MGASYRTCVLIFTIHLISYVTSQELDKRGPQGFLGMRGKKLEDNELYKRKPQFFVGVKGKKTIYDLLEPEYYKRAPMGFMGMRGKKDGDYQDIDDYARKMTQERRNSLIGQIDYSSNENDIEEFPFLNEILTHYLQKIESPNPTESNDIDFTKEIVKRGGNMHQFFGVRGKKALQKRLADVSFRGKFIGVRGKKDLKNSGAQEIKFLLDNGPFPKRKGQMGFIGMRGKKWTDPDFDVSESSPEVDAKTNNPYQELIN